MEYTLKSPAKSHFKIHFRIIGQYCPLKNALLQKELIETNGKEIVLADPVFEVWFKKEMHY